MRIKILVLFLFVSSLSFAQIKTVQVSESKTIGKIAPGGCFFIECTKSDSTYTFMYRDMTYTQIDEYKSFSFKDENFAFENLFQTIIAGFDNPPEKDIMLELPDCYLWISFQKSMGITCVRFASSVGKDSKIIGFSQTFTKKQILKLFNVQL